MNKDRDTWNSTFEILKDELRDIPFLLHSVPSMEIASILVEKKGCNKQVVSIGVGTRWLSHPVPPKNKGTTLLDCQAVTIARRAFKLYLFQEIFNYYSNSSSDIFEDHSEKDGKICVKEGVKFHLFVSKISEKTNLRLLKLDQASFDQGNASPYALFDEGLGCAVEKVCTDENIHQNSFYAMSALDKLRLWCVTGIQGSLLTHFLHPIYIKSITLGGSGKGLAPSIACLFQSLSSISDDLPEKYHIQMPETFYKPIINNDNESCQLMEVLSMSVNWYLGGDAEVLDAGKVYHLSPHKSSEGYSRLCKRGLLQTFRRLVEKSGRLELLLDPTYKEAKMSALDYHKCKNTFLACWEFEGRGQWYNRQSKIDDFQL